MNDKEKAERIKLIAQHRLKNRGLTPKQIEHAFTEKATSSQSKVVKTKLTRAIGKPVHVIRSSQKNAGQLKLLLESPAATSTRYSKYPTPDWFTNSSKCDVSIIVPMFKSDEVIQALIESWDLNNDGLNVEVIFVDDCCPKGSKEAVMSAWIKQKSSLKKPIGQIICNTTESGGFASACNAGAQVANGEYLIFLNADTLVTPGWIRPITRLLKKEEVGLVGNLQFKKASDGNHIIDSAGSEWNWDTLNFLHIGRNVYKGKQLTKSFTVNNCAADISQVKEVDMVTGCCVGIRKSLFDEIGGFNPNYRIGYWEDSELSMAIKEKGYKVMFQPNSKIFHEGSHSGSGGHKFQEHNRNYFMNKWVNSGRIDSLVTIKRTLHLPEVKHILLKRDAAHGDVLMAAAVAPALKKKYKDCKITFTTICPEIVDNNPDIDKVVRDIDFGERSFQLYYNLDMAYEYRPFTNILEAYADIVGVKVEDCQPHLPTEKPAIELPAEYVVMHAGKTNWVGRNWSQNKFEVIANKLRKAGQKLICIGGKSDHKVPCDIDLRDQTTIPQLSYVIKHAKLFVGIDSFPMHIAQTFDVNGVSFFGAIKPETRIITPTMRTVTAAHLACLGCHHFQPKPCTVTAVCKTELQDCINNVTVDQMWKKIKDVWSETFNEELEN